MKILYFDGCSGISGDMTVGALLDLGMPFDHLKSELDKLRIEGFSVSKRKVEKHKIVATKFDVEVTADKGHRHLNDIAQIIDNSELPGRVKEIALNAFRRLAAAEAKVHNSTPEKIHFHEVGGIDAIVDIVGTAIGITYFNPDKIFSSSLRLGSGMTKSSHGTIPIPSPATVELLKGIPTVLTDIPGERVTPTGAAIIATLLELYEGKSGKTPQFGITASGYGAGSRDYDDCPNLLRILMGESDHESGYEIDSVSILETNIDDLNPQIFDHLLNSLFTAGALDVFIVPVLMKKNRPGNLLSVLCKNDLSEKLCDIIFSETSTAGIRFRSQERYILARSIKPVETEYGKIRVKILSLKDGIKIQPEYDDCAGAAQEYKVPLAKVIDTARKKAEIEEGRV